MEKNEYQKAVFLSDQSTRYFDRVTLSWTKTLGEQSAFHKGANGLAGASGLARDSIAVSPVESVHSERSAPSLPCP
jgi:hypothetical protein